MFFADFMNVLKSNKLYEFVGTKRQVKITILHKLAVITLKSI